MPKPIPILIAFAACCVFVATTRTVSAQGVIPLPDLFLGPNDVLPVQLGGTVVGVDSDLYLIEGEASLEGRLDLPFINGYIPLPGESIQIMDAQFIGFDFRSYFFPEPLPPGVAVDFFQTPQSYHVVFTTVGPAVNFVSTNPINNWNDEQNWSNGEAPDSPNVVFIQNNTPNPNQIVRVFGGPSADRNPAHADTIQLLGAPGSDVIVEISQGGALSASRRINVGENTNVNILNGSLVSNIVVIEPGGQISMQNGEIISGNASTVIAGKLFGNGKVEGSLRLVAGGAIEIGPDTMGNGGVLEVVGDYFQATGGDLLVDVPGSATAARDRLLISGVADLKGKLRVDLSGFSNFHTAGPIEIITAGTIDGTSRFDTVEATGISQQGVYAAATYTPNTVALEAFFVGDMNRDNWLDANDVDFFALALRDRGGYENYTLPDGSKIGISGDITGDMDFDGDLDFDDIDELIAALPAAAALYAQQVLLGSTVPEPSTIWLAATGVLLVGARYRK